MKERKIRFDRFDNNTKSHHALFVGTFLSSLAFLFSKSLEALLMHAVWQANLILFIYLVFHHPFTNSSVPFSASPSKDGKGHSRKDKSR